MRIGTTNPANWTPTSIPVACGVKASTTAMIAPVTAKLVAHTAVSTTLVCMNIGVSQNSRGGTRLANPIVNGRPSMIDTAAATASVPGVSAGTYRCSPVVGSANATTANPAKKTAAAIANTSVVASRLPRTSAASARTDATAAPSRQSNSAAT